MDSKRNFILAIVLSAAILFGWSAISDRLLPTANPPATRIVQAKQVAVANPAADPPLRPRARLRRRNRDAGRGGDAGLTS